MPFSPVLEPLLGLSDTDLWARGLPRCDVHAIVAERERRAALVRQWAECCPPAYRASDWSNPELSPYRRAIDAALAWRPGHGGKPGVLLVGVPGVGKTRCLMAIARRLLVEEHRALTGPITAKSLADEALAAEREGRLSSWAAGRTRLPLLVDDLGQERSPWQSTEAFFCSAWRLLLDGLIGNGIPLIATTNLRTADWEARAPTGYLGDAVARRLFDLCTIVDFKPEE